MIEATTRFPRYLAQTKRKDLKASKGTKTVTMSNELTVTICLPIKEGECGEERGKVMKKKPLL